MTFLDLILNKPSSSTWLWIRIRIRIGSGSNGVPGSGYGSRRAKITHKNRKKVNKFHYLKCWMFSFEGWRLFSCSLDVLYRGVIVKKILLYFFFFKCWSLTPWIRILIRIHLNAGSRSGFRIYNNDWKCVKWRAVEGMLHLIEKVGRPHQPVRLSCRVCQPKTQPGTLSSPIQH